MKIKLFLILIVSSTCFSTDRDVPADYATIQLAIDAASSGDNIVISTGTYNASAILPAAKNLVFKSPETGTKAVLTRASGGSQGFFRITSDCTGYTYEFQDLTFKENYAAHSNFSFAANCGANLKLIRCKIDNDDVMSDSDVLYCAATIPAYARNLEFVDSEIEHSGFTGSNFMNLISFNKVSFLRTTINYVNANASGLMVLGGNTGDIYINNNLFNVTDAAVFTGVTYDIRSFLFQKNIVRATFITKDSSILAFGTQNIFTTPIIYDNVFDILGTSTQTWNGIKCLNTNCPAFSVLENTFTAPNQTKTIGSFFINIQGTGFASANFINNRIVGNAQYGIYLQTPIAIISGNYIDCCNPVRTNGGSGYQISGNTLIANNYVGLDEGRCLVLSRQTLSGVSAKGPTINAWNVVGSSWDLSGVGATSRNMLCILGASTNDSVVPIYYGLVTAATDANDTVMVDRWIRCSDDSIVASIDATNYYATVVKFANGSTIYNNFMDGHLAANTLTFDFNPRSGNNYIDWNMYRAGTVSLSNLGYPRLAPAVQINLDTQRIVWQTWPTTSEQTYHNDAHSIQNLDTSYHAPTGWIPSLIPTINKK
ncbi:MAG: hypothetical protein A2Y12_08835 [Planctomycetes bacterium GWF2_42_9]|nr:MAG: hypothetical protein A2Y12_08835 [Planctomycetes bacterium GWF2_42_9]HAL45503.1 hypothetical protein [Phycisphaerales bacterium]